MRGKSWSNWLKMLQNLVIGVAPPSLDGEVGRSAIMIPVGSAPSSFRIPSANLDKSDREYLREEQRSQTGCSAGRMQSDFHHGLLIPIRRSRDIRRAEFSTRTHPC